MTKDVLKFAKEGSPAPDLRVRLSRSHRKPFSDRFDGGDLTESERVTTTVHCTWGLCGSGPDRPSHQQYYDRHPLHLLPGLL